MSDGAFNSAIVELVIQNVNFLLPECSSGDDC